MITCNYLLQKRTNCYSLISHQNRIIGRCCRRFSAATSTSYSTNSRVTVAIDGTGICRVELNRPNKLNSLDLKMFDDIAETVSSLKSDRSIRAVILSGQGRAFCTGLDVKAVMKGGNPQIQIDKLLERKPRPSNDNYDDKTIVESNLAQDVSILWRELDAPVIAVLHGMCYGAGLQIALGADFRYATPDCKLSIMEGKWGLIPDMGISVFLRELVRIDVAKELTMTGRIISGTEANKLGLVTRVCEDPMKDAEIFALELVERSPDAIAAAKQLFQRTWTAVSEDESLRLESKLQRRLLKSWNQLTAAGRSALGWEFPYRNRK
jgi:enoyl-CoA hydratase/carnithine racemase